MKFLVPLVLVLSVGACADQNRLASNQFTLPPRNSIVPNPEAAPKIMANEGTDVVALKEAAAFGRANRKLRQAGENYDRLKQSLEVTSGR